jgi:predicted aldo/keto reductase-like oxidoreductase
MNYRNDKYGNPLSILGFGCMRFQRKGSKIDMEKAEKQIMDAYRGGVNYYDTAYIYPGSEAALGEILEKNGIRQKVYIATKLPHYLVKTAADLDKIFNEELKRLRTDYVDYYLMHMLTDVNAWERMKSLGILEWIEEKKKSGAIRQVGFSYHGNSQIFCDLVDAWDWDFCQIQYNYMDEHTQAGRRGLYHAHEKGIPVIIMEPLRGGKLVNNLCAEAEEIFAGHEPKRTPAQWAFRWLWNQPEVTVVLSGMNTDEMVADNMMTASTVEVGELTAADEAMLQQVVKAINAGMKVGCTACAYCMPCPKGVNIPGTFAAYNRIYSESKFAGMKEYFMSNALRKEPTLASQCVGCGKCEKHCPQGIAIRQELKNAQKELENPVFNAARKLAGLITKFKG